MIVGHGNAVFLDIARSISAQTLAQSMAQMKPGKMLASLGQLDLTKSRPPVAR